MCSQVMIVEEMQVTDVIWLILTADNWFGQRNAAPVTHFLSIIINMAQWVAMADIVC